MTQIKNLIFDLGVVLVNLNRGECMNAFKNLGIDNIEEMTSLALHNGIFGNYEQGLLTTGEFYDEVRALAKKDLSDEEISAAWLLMVNDLPVYKLERLLQLKKQYRLFLLSNTNELHWKRCADTMFCYEDKTVGDFFEKRWLSYEIHLLKPSQEIFEYVLADGGLKAEETFFIDDAGANCDAAKSLGIKTYQPQPYEDWSPVFNLK
ncbi:MAG: HAD family phosphatase [Bacteroidales bacterium]